jgi:hypothetical protein
MEQCYDGALKLCPTASVHGCGRECLPHDCFTNVSGNEQRNARPETIAFLNTAKTFTRQNFQQMDYKPEVIHPTRGQ